ncbi:MAG: thioredoxin family protein [Deltaproteobacteria bacterium]|nr:thioredoxin family protein [Deltaproteobacteria bacterium]MBW2072701.1 thioredoxin family protein [Deltaproteobacteria bacterium]
MSPQASPFYPILGPSSPKKLAISICFLLSLLLLAVSGSSAPKKGPQEQTAPIRLEVESYPRRIAPGQDVWLAVKLTIRPGWHIYGNPKGPGPGLPTTLQVISAPQQVQAKASRFLPAEKMTARDLGPDEWNWAYQGSTIIYQPLSTAATLQPGDYAVDLRLKTLLCTEGLCLPYQKKLRASFTVLSPSSPGEQLPAEVRRAIASTHPAGASTPLESGSGLLSSKQAEKTTASPLAEIPPLQPRPMLRALEVNTFLKAVLFAFLAGFILNFMPCVLPVISLKIIGFVQHAEAGRHRVSLMGLCFASGIVLVFLVLAFLAAFAGYGWGELFQKQSFLIAMIALVFALSLCLFGVFQLPVPSFAARSGAAVERQGYWESFYKGVMATFLATPCSGPLLGSAMAWTLRQPPAMIFVIFACMGIGMAAPYMVLTAFPASMKWLPRPGAWLIHFERLMGFALLGTVVYLLTILPQSERLWVVIFCLFLALGLYIWGQMTTLRDSTRRRLVVRSIAVLVIAGGLWFSFAVAREAAWMRGSAPGKPDIWLPYSDEQLLAAAGENRWVVVDFTADWCPNCLLVEKTALHNPRVLQAFKKYNVLLLKADLTRKNPAAERLLEKLGSRSIPFLAFFPPGKQFWQPYFLRDVYRSEEVLLVFSRHEQR